MMSEILIGAFAGTCIALLYLFALAAVARFAFKRVKRW